VQACDPSHYAKVHKRPRCPVPGCKERLTTVNSYCCKDCRATVCLKHRFGSDHACPGRAGAPRLLLAQLARAASTGNPCRWPGRRVVTWLAERCLLFLCEGLAPLVAALGRRPLCT